MKKTLISLSLAIILLLSSVLSSCAAKLVYKNDVYYCAKNGVSYVPVDIRYVSATIGEKYATLKDETDVELYEIQGVSPKKWLTTEDGMLYCSVDEKIPTLNEMGIDKVTIAAVGDKATVALSEINKRDHVDYVMDSFFNGMELNYPSTYEVSESLMLDLWAEEYPWLYYTLYYVEFVTDVLVSDYPENFDTYVYRDVDDSVAIRTLNELECRYKVMNSDEQKKYEDMARDAGIDFYTVTKPDGSGSATSTYVVFVYEAIDTKEEAIEYFLSKYEGNKSANAVREALDKSDSVSKTNRVEYNYGKYFIYDRLSGRCVKVNDLLHKYRNYQEVN